MEKKYIKKLLIITMYVNFILKHQNVYSQIIIKNSLETFYYVAFSYYASNAFQRGWVSIGWYYLSPGEEIEIVKQTPKERYLYYYAFNEEDTIRGYKKTLVNPNKNEQFFIKQAILNQTKTDNKTLEWLLFKEHRRSELFIRKKRKYTIEIKK